MQKPHKPIVDAVKQQLRDAGATLYEIAKQETVELARILFDDEKIEAFMYGYYEAGFGLLVATNKRIIFVDKRFYNLKVEDIPYNTVNSVEYHLGIFFGVGKIYTRAQNFNFWWVKKSNLMNFCNFVDMKMYKSQQ